MIRRLRSVLKKTPFEIKDIELNDTVREAIGLVRAVADGRRIALSYVPACVDLHVKGDPVQLQQVVLNLIINAMDAISDADMKKREVSVSTARAGNQAEIRIADTGPGIAAGDLANVFNPFFTTKPQGMGMGLAIAKTIVEAHHGTMRGREPASRRGAVHDQAADRPIAPPAVPGRLSRRNNRRSRLSLISINKRLRLGPMVADGKSDGGCDVSLRQDPDGACAGGWQSPPLQWLRPPRRRPRQRRPLRARRRSPQAHRRRPPSF